MLKMNLNLFDFKWNLIETNNSCSCSFNDFCKAVDVWLMKPHVLNRRICTSQMLWRKEIPNTKLLTFLEGCINSDAECTAVQDNSSNDSKCVECCLRKLLPRNRRNETVNEIIVIDNSSATVIFIPLENPSASIPSLGCENLINNTGYKIEFNESDHSLKLFVGQDYSISATSSFARPSIPWLKNQLLPKLIKWATENNEDSGNQFTSLVAMDKYSKLYAELKQKYGAKFVKLWTEVTDPQKFVYEDVAIAAYILTLWRQETDELGLTTPQSFIDLGCGNGLLVHILTCEGHRGKGVDLRKRKIWDLYGEETCLEESAITPSDSNLFPEYDWLIGNHSDELTPWIPVIASRSSFNTRYFVLPCCFHDFNRKFARVNSNQGQYRAYLDFVFEIGQICGFTVLEDRLRIPSTKRICHVGKTRTYKQEEQKKIDSKIKELIEKRSSTKKTDYSNNMQVICESESSDSYRIKRELDETQNVSCQKIQRIDQHDKTTCGDDSKNWVQGFTAREKVERVRNCATVCRDLRQEIVNKVALKLLEEGGVQLRSDTLVKDTSLTDNDSLDDTPASATPATDTHSFEDDTQTVVKEWRRGGELYLSAVASFLGSDTLKKLKQECGGLKTLLKNANQVFEVSGNTVKIRDWANRENEPGKAHASLKNIQDKELLFKTKHCWFHSNHPDGCPRKDHTCPFAHGDNDLRERATFK
ncbi:probable tRNA (uracil-O(2)-)-methyltransferase [Antedon mediterranea]|uniref:probable tRNA (uracil-O(2)-)-methyltransferase n=1 Tax=Antedon mediterranea TaxID=105859 RepID=UPI003AF9D09F